MALVVLIIDRIVERRRRRTQPFETKVLLFEPPVEAPAPEIVKVRDLESFHRDDPAWPRKLSRRTHFAVTEPSQSGVKGTREILPLSEGAARVWAEHVDDLFLGALWSEKIVDGGEDAMPLMMYSGKEQRVLGTVLDGLGGSGAAKIHWESERVVSNAWESARLVRATLETVAASDPSLTTFTSAIPHGLEAVIKKTLSKRADEIVGSKAALSSSLTRILPTTVAGFVLDTSASPQLTTFWAGDSRAYILDADVGLQVLTVDDAEDMDAFEALVVDPPLTNVLCADRPFTLNYRKDGVPRQSLVIAASDGCFNYWPTPPNFEFEILSAICGASSWESAVRQLTRSIGGVTNDDTSLVIVAIGFSTFIELQQRFARRHAEIKQLAFDPLAQLRKDSGTREDFETYRSEAWRIYKKGYEGRLGGSVEG